MTFTPPASDGGSAITSYTATATGGRTATGSGSPLVVTGLTNGHSYAFTVTATNEAGTGPASSPSKTVVPATTPGAPTAVTVTGGNALASVGFTPPVSTAAQPITSYTVKATDLTNPANGGETITGSSGPMVVTGLTDGDSYTFTVTATNAVGMGLTSSPSSAVVPGATGYWLVAKDGGIFAYGDAGFLRLPRWDFALTCPSWAWPPPPMGRATGWWPATVGSSPTGTPASTAPMGGSPLNQPIVGMAPTPDGQGYWLVARDGGIFAYGNARFYGSHGGSPLNQPIVGMASTPERTGLLAGGQRRRDLRLRGRRLRRLPRWGSAQRSPSWVWPPLPTDTATGWWPATAGSSPTGTPASKDPTEGAPLNAAIVSMAAAPNGKGYWLMASDGGIFAYGNAGFYGSHGGAQLNQPIVGGVAASA